MAFIGDRGFGRLPQPDEPDTEPSWDDVLIRFSRASRHERSSPGVTRGNRDAGSCSCRGRTAATREDRRRPGYSQPQPASLWAPQTAVMNNSDWYQRCQTRSVFDLRHRAGWTGELVRRGVQGFAGRPLRWRARSLALRCLAGRASSSALVPEVGFPSTTRVASGSTRFLHGWTNEPRRAFDASD